MAAKNRAKKEAKAPAKKAAGRKKKSVEHIAMTPESLKSAALAIQDSLKDLVENHKKSPLTFATLDDIKASYIPFNNIYLEYLWGTRGLVEHTLGEIIGPEGSGKTTFSFYLIGRALNAGSPAALYLETEEKPMDKDRIKRNFSFVKADANRMLKSVSYAQVHTLAEMCTHVEAWAKHVREVVKLPINIPGIIVVDTWSKLMNEAEAMGYYEEDPDMMDADAKKKLKEIGEASNLGHAKFAHAWCRRLPYFLKMRNMVLILVQHQNEDIVMATKGKGGAQAKTGLFNKRKIGGKAFDQNSAWQLILKNGDQWKTSDKLHLLGHDVNARMDKNSYGARGRCATWKLRNEQLNDTPDILDPALWFELDGSRWLVDCKMIGACVTQGKYSCEALSASAVKAPELWAALYSRPDIVNGLGRALKISGYELEEI